MMSKGRLSEKEPFRVSTVWIVPQALPVQLTVCRPLEEACSTPASMVSLLGLAARTTQRMLPPKPVFDLEAPSQAAPVQVQL